MHDAAVDTTSSETPPEDMLPDMIPEMPSSAGRALTYLVFLFVLSALSWAYFTRVDMVVTAEAVIRAGSDLPEIEAPVDGLVRRIPVREGDYVREGQTLAVMATDGSTETAVKSPMDGYVVQRRVQPGLHADRGQGLITIFPDRIDLVAEIKIPNRDRGRVRAGDRVHLKIDALPHLEYGILPGTLMRVMPYADPTDGTYTGFVSLDQTHFRIDGQNTPVLSGMTAAADIVVEQKTILDLLLKSFRAI